MPGLSRKLLGVMGLNPFDNHNSSSRKQMFSSHIQQNLVIDKPSIKKIQTGMENEFGKYTFGVRMPENGRILKIFTRFPKQEHSLNGFKLSPESIVFYEGENGIGIFSIKKYCSNHPKFGFQYKKGPAYSKLQPGNYIEKGEIILDSPNKGPNNEYTYGRELNIAFLNHPAVAEDGIAICSDVLPGFSFHSYEKRVVSWGGDMYPINLYGDETHYKPFPDIGEYVHPHNNAKGLLMALRHYDEEMLGVEQSVPALQKLDEVFDEATYTNGEGGRVIDIKIYHVPVRKGDSLCDEMMEQPIKYNDATLDFYQRIYKYYLDLKRERKERFVITPELQNYIVNTLAILNPNIKKLSPTLFLTYKNETLNEWRAEFTVEYKITPTTGFKLTGLQGDKGTICCILKPEEMPVAANGLRADIIMDGTSTINRMNWSRTYEQYLNGVKYDIELRCLNMLGLDKQSADFDIEKKVMNAPHKLINQIADYINSYHDIVSPKQGAWMRNLSFEKKRQYILDALTGFLVDYHPSETDIDDVKMLQEIEAKFHPTFDKIKYHNDDGSVEYSNHPVRIGSMYFMLLNKTGNDWSAVANAKTQQNGIISYTSNKDKHATPTKKQAIRFMGESEVRVLLSHAGGYFTADIHDRSNNPTVKKEIVRNLLTTDKPGALVSAIDRNKYPLGYSKPLQILNHLFSCAGFKLEYKPFDPSQQEPSKSNIYIADEDLVKFTNILDENIKYNKD